MFRNVTVLLYHMPLGVARVSVPSRGWCLETYTHSKTFDFYHSDGFRPLAGMMFRNRQISDYDHGELEPIVSVPSRGWCLETNGTESRTRSKKTRFRPLAGMMFRNWPVLLFQWLCQYSKGFRPLAGMMFRNPRPRLLSILLLAKFPSPRGDDV